jgi:peptidoglycan/xylan/chitin deacetylase (PgdA/CDA1 family)
MRATPSRSAAGRRRVGTAAILVVALLGAAVGCAVDDRPVALDEHVLASATYPLDGTQVTLVDGTADVDIAGQPVTVRLAPPVALGDLDGDGADDAAVLLTATGPDAVSYTSLALVRNDDGHPQALPALPIGADLVPRSLAIDQAQARLQVLTRGEGQPTTVVDELRTTTVGIQGGQVVVLGDEVGGLETLPPPASVLPDSPVAFPEGDRVTAVSGQLAGDQAARHTLAIERNESLDLLVSGSLGVVGSVTVGEAVLVDSAEGQVEVEFAAGGTAVVVVRNLGLTGASYELALELHDPPPAPPPPVDSSGNIVHLTFDDGPHPTYTPQVLDVLAKYGAKATFFVTGSQSQAHPDLLDRIVAEGHTLANHTWNHPSLVGMSDQGFDDQVGRTQALLGNRGTACLRPPYGAVDDTTRRQAADMGLRIVLWTADTNDWQRPGADVIARRIVAGTHGGANILMHDGGGPREQTVAGLDMALAQMASEGWDYRPAC